MMKLLNLVAFFLLGFANLINVDASMTDKATGITFAPKVNDLDVHGVGVRKKGPIKVYSVGMYTSASLKEKLATLSKTTDKLKALAELRSGAGSERPVTFMLEMSFKIGAEKMASAIAESVAPRHKGSPKDVDELKSMIFNGVDAKGGTATKGTKFQFDCDNSGVSVCVDGKSQGSVSSPSLSSAFCDVYLDDKTVSSALRENCLNNWCLE